MEQNWIRRIDDLGRIAIPKDYRRILRLHENDPVEVILDEESRSITLKPYYSLKHSDIISRFQMMERALSSSFPHVRLWFCQGRTDELYDIVKCKLLKELNPEVEQKAAALANSVMAEKTAETDAELTTSVVPIWDENVDNIEGFLVGAAEDNCPAQEFNKFTVTAETLMKYLIWTTKN